MIMYDDRGLERFVVDADSNDTCIKLWDTGTQHYGESGVKLCQTISDGPSILLTDKQNFQALMGSTSLVDTRVGEQHKRSAASLVLLGSGNCKGNNWCVCGRVDVVAMTEQGSYLTHPGPEPPPGSSIETKVWVLKDQELEISAYWEGFEGSVSQYRTELSHSETVSIGEADGKRIELPWPDLRCGGFCPGSVKHTWKKAGTYTVYGHLKGYYHWSGEDGSCSYTCGTKPGCRQNSWLTVIVIDEPAPGKTYPTTEP